MWFSLFYTRVLQIYQNDGFAAPLLYLCINIHCHSGKILHSLYKKLHSAFSINAYNRVCLENDRRYGYDEKDDRRQPGKIDFNVYDSFADRKYLSAII